MDDGGPGLVIIRRLHRMVRHGYRPWLGYDVASGEDREIHLRRKDNEATIHRDGAVSFVAPFRSAAAGPAGYFEAGAEMVLIAGHEEALFDAVFPANTRNRRNIVRRLYEIGLGSW